MKNFIVIILFLFNHDAFSQSRLKSFSHLSRPEKWWVIFHPFIASKAKKISDKAVADAKELKKNSRLDGDWNGGQIDAFRHAYWMALMSHEFCWKKAIALGKAHEKGNYLSYKKGVLDEDGSLPDSIACEMDLHNNNIGAAIGCNSKAMPADSIKNLIINSILRGEMRIISKNADGIPLNCEGIPINKSLYTNKWSIPKCLVRSDIRQK